MVKWYIKRNLRTYSLIWTWFWDADACNLHLEMLIMQKVLNHENCVMLMTFFPIFVILILIWFFFLWKTHIDCLFLEDMIIHATLFFFFLQISSMTPLECMFLFDHLKILEWRQWSCFTFNQSTETLILWGIKGFELKRNHTWWDSCYRKEWDLGVNKFSSD